MKKRILHIIPDLRVGGAERSLVRLIKSSPKDVEHFVLRLKESPKESSLLSELDCQTASLNLGSPNLLRIFRTLFSIQKNFQPQIVQGWLYWGAFFSVVFKAIFLKSKSIWFFRHSLDHWKSENFKTQLLIRILRMFSNPSVWICVNSESGMLQHRKTGLRAGRWELLPNGVAIPNQLASFDERQELRRKFGISSDAKVIGYVARFDGVKNPKLFLEAFARVQQTEPNLYLIAAGRGWEKSNIELQYLVPHYKIDVERVRLVGEIKEVRQVYRAIDIFCMSSETEGTPNALLEALSEGTPSLSTPVGDAAKIIEDYGQVTQSHAVEDYQARLQSLLNRSFTQEEREKTYRRIRDQYSLDAENKKYLRLLEDRLL